MSGHSKWSQIKRKKEVKDKQRGSIFTKLSKLISLAVVEGGRITDPEHNVKLRLAIEKAKQENMPKENIERALEKGAGSQGEQLKEICYEAFGPKGVALLIIAASDNSTRTASEVKNTLDKHGGKLGAQGSVSYQFSHVGVYTLSKMKNEENNVYEFAEQLGAVDIEDDGGDFIIYIPFQAIGRTRAYSSKVILDKQDIEYKPNTFIAVERADQEKILNLIEMLEGLEDIQAVYTNALAAS